ncbi:hypothetical protein SG34_007950 [Thalassomonas viridans]|uniref:Uncharacterized protein n=1 Tax=Thalassomonas viridans TaxID=137584 RepID=A0AAE9Z4Y2_9GAMM|nr:hypothetical protein [Thalassomonas viridans]WDE06821.1 hypothetical protein SG34_007950 [Thalassomonas viridans]
MYVENNLEKFSLALLAQMGEKFSRGEATLGDARLLCESVCEYQMYLAAKHESLLSPLASSVSDQCGAGYGG